MGKKARLKKLRRQFDDECFLTPNQMEQARRVESQFPDATVVHVQGGEKMSVVLSEFAEPLLTHARTRDEIQKTVMMAATAWNYSISPPDLQQKLDRDFEKKFPAYMREVLDFFIARKRDLYPDNNRYILDCSFDFKEGRFAVNVVSTFEPARAIG